jgi:hypothetical protein
MNKNIFNGYVLTINPGKYFTKGYVKNHSLNGKGSSRFADGSTYEGEFKDDKKNGKGKFRYADGGTY